LTAIDAIALSFLIVDAGMGRLLGAANGALGRRLLDVDRSSGLNCCSGPG